MSDLVTEHKRVLERVSSEVEVSVFGSDVITAVAFVFDGERRRYGLVQDIDRTEFDLDFAGIHLGVLALTLDYFAFCLDDEFASERVGHLNQFCRSIGAYHQLGYTISVAKVNECHSSEFSGSLDPSGKNYFLACVCESELTASVCSEISIEHNML